MHISIKSIRPFLGCVDFNISRSFYINLGFEEIRLNENFSVFKKGAFAFYLQQAYVKDWIDNTMVFLEVADLNAYHDYLTSLQLHVKFEDVRLSAIKVFDWGRECYLHDPSGILWHIGEFNDA